MEYLTYEEYQDIGGTAELTTFNRYADRAFGVIDNATFLRVKSMAEIPSSVKSLCRELIDFFVNNPAEEGEVTSHSQSAGGVSESKSFAVNSSEDKQKIINNLVYDYLYSVYDDNGTSLLYKGCSH